MHIKAGTILVGKFVVTIHFCFREHPLQEVHQRQHGINLEGCHRVLGLAEEVETTDVADADAVGIMAFAVASDGLQVLAYLDGAFQVYHVVVAAVRAAREWEASLLVPAGKAARV